MQTAGGKHRLTGIRIPQLHTDIPLPVQPVEGLDKGVVLCFGDRLLVHSLNQQQLVDPLQYISWPELQLGDTVLVVPQEGDWVLVNRQPTLVQESMLGVVDDDGFFLSIDTNGHAHPHWTPSFVQRHVCSGGGPPTTVDCLPITSARVGTTTATRSTCTFPRECTSPRNWNS